MSSLHRRCGERLALTFDSSYREQRRHVRVHLAHNAVVDVEQLTQALHGQVSGDGAILPSHLLRLLE